MKGLGICTPYFYSKVRQPNLHLPFIQILNDLFNSSPHGYKIMAQLENTNLDFMKHFLYLYRDVHLKVPENNATDDAEVIVNKKTLRPATSMTEVLLGLFMFFLGIISLIFLAFYMYSRILNSGS